MARLRDAESKSDALRMGMKMTVAVAVTVLGNARKGASSERAASRLISAWAMERSTYYWLTGA